MNKKEREFEKKLILRQMFGCIPDMQELPDSLFRKLFYKIRRCLKCLKYTKQ